MKTIIILMPVNNKDGVGRPELELIENNEYDTVEALKEALKTPCDFYTVSEFMDLCNDQEVHIEGVWVGYVRVPNSVKV